MDRERDSSGSETGDGDTPVRPTSQNAEIPRPNSRTRTSSEEELTLLSENADPNVQDPHRRNSIFWPPHSSSEGSVPRMRGSARAMYHWNNIPPRRVRPNRPWTSRERYFNNFQVMNQQLPYLFYRQYLRQEILRSYMSPLYRLPLPAQFLARNHQPIHHPVFAWTPADVNQSLIIRHGYSGSSSSSYSSNNPSPASFSGSQSNPNGVPIVERFNFIGMGESDIHNNTRLLLKQDETDDDMTCVICMSLITKLELLRKLPCRHIFHKDCIDKWLGFNGICPTCRRDVRCRRQATSPASH